MRGGERERMKGVSEEMKGVSEGGSEREMKGGSE